MLYADGVAITQFEFGRYSSRALRNQGYAVTDTVLGKGSIAKLPDDLREGDKIDVTFLFRKNGMLSVEGRVNRQGKPQPVALQFEVTVDGRMADEDVEICTSASTSSHPPTSHVNNDA